MKRKLRAFATSVVALLWGCSQAATEARAADPVLTRLLGDVLWAPRLAYGSDDQTAQHFGIPISSLHETAYRIVLAGKLEAALAPGQTDPNAQQAALSDYLVALSKQEGISVSPRYGVWDLAKGVIVSDGFSTPFQGPIPVASPS